MFKKNNPKFTQGRILKNEMLEELRDFSRNVVDITYANYSEGIISGFDLRVDQENITISQGIVKYQKEIIVLGETIKIPYEADDTKQILKLQFGENVIDADFETRVVKIILEDKPPQPENELELARFRLNKGAYLRLDYQNFEDFLTGHNTLNLVHQPYSSTNGTTLNPAILKYFARELLTYKTEHPHDLAIIYQVLNQNASISQELLTNYLQIRIEKSEPIQTNEQIHNGLTQILKMAKREMKNPKIKSNNNRKLIVD